MDLQLDEQLREREAELRRGEQVRAASRPAQRVVERAAAGRQPARAGHRRGRGLRRLQAGEEAPRGGEAPPLVAPRAAGLGGEAPLRGGHGGGRGLLVHRQQTGEALGAEGAQRAPVLQLAAVAARHGAGELSADRRRVQRRPRRGGEVQQRELARPQRRVGPHAREPRVHSLRVGVEALAQGGRQPAQLGRRSSGCGACSVSSTASSTRAIPRTTSSKTCSTCGAVKAKLRLAETVFTCEKCGARLDRDINAALNLARLAFHGARSEGRVVHLAAAQAARGATDPEAFRKRPTGRPL